MTTMIKRTKLPNHYDKARRYGDGYLTLPDPLDAKRLVRVKEAGAEVTWTEDGTELTGQVWDQAPAARTYWVAVTPEDATFPGELRTAWTDGDDWDVAPDRYTPGGVKIAPAELAGLAEAVAA